MVITNEQLEQIISGKLAYYSCDGCGKHSELGLTNADPICPHCGDYLNAADEGWDFGFGYVEDHRQFGLSYEFRAGDFSAGY